MIAIATCSHPVDIASLSQDKLPIMYICNCNAIKESDLRKLARHCSGDAENLYAKLGKRPNCGQCLFDANFLVEEERADIIEPAVAA